MSFLDPRFHIFPKLQGETPHFVSLEIGYSIGPFVVGDISLLAESIEHPNSGRVCAEREFQRMDDTVMMVSTLRSVSRCCQRCSGELQRRVVGDVESPVRDQAFRLASLEIPVSDCEQIGDFFAVWIVVQQPSVPAPVF
jgi:hypothetical protein